jgi:GxxExxY protein
LLTMKEVDLQVETEKPFEVVFKNKVIGRYHADLVVEKKVIVELKCCENLVREHQAQLFNYLRVSGIPIGLLVNFRRRKLEYQRLHQSEVKENEVEEPLPL